MKANHNQVGRRDRNLIDVFQWTKIQFWKQITTSLGDGYKEGLMYFNELRYNFESKSQRSTSKPTLYLDVFQWTKIQFWKQITTTSVMPSFSAKMYFNELRYNFESKSQLHQYRQEIFLDVFQWTKIQFWKQITT